MEKELKFSIDGVQYVMTPVNASDSWKALKRASALFKGVDIEKVKGAAGNGEKTSVAIGTLLSNLGDPAVEEIEDLVFASTVAKVGGKVYRISDDFDAHFNQYRSHLLRVLMEGVKYQYSDFFAGVVAMLKGLLPTKP
ncbi:phage tail assembly chaperone [Luteibacter sp.]|jgi:hypothetical protein|uniref:phage tail assembly chaperone n=1 Tax=Luteibacter sp. TaxID=1886636 RepID=UPI002F423120